MKEKLIASVFLMILVSANQLIFAEELTDKIAYKLAGIHAKNLAPGKRVLGYTLKPSNAVISEFEWMLGALKGRCLNPETALADTIVQVWQSAKNSGYRLTILEIARELTKTAKDTTLFGPGKVNFIMTSQYWVAKKLPLLKKY